MKPWAEHAARWLPAALLVLVAANQLRLAHIHDLSPWSGGGFGMFSSTDSPANRHLHAFLETEGVRRELHLPAVLGDAARRATTLPTRERLARFADMLLAETDPGRIRWERLEIQVWGVDYDRRSLTPEGVLLRRERFDLAGR